MGIDKSKRNVTISQAREILGEDHKHLTDEQIQAVLDFMYQWAEMDVNSWRKNQPEKTDENSI